MLTDVIPRPAYPQAIARFFLLIGYWCGDSGYRFH